jgi:hypothetical protein
VDIVCNLMAKLSFPSSDMHCLSTLHATAKLLWSYCFERKYATAGTEEIGENWESVVLFSGVCQVFFVLLTSPKEAPSRQLLQVISLAAHSRIDNDAAVDFLTARVAEDSRPIVVRRTILLPNSEGIVTGKSSKRKRTQGSKWPNTSTGTMPAGALRT